MTEEIKKRKCLKCRQEKPETNFCKTQSKFFPGHRSMICTSCLETMVAQDNFAAVDHLCRYLDVPFDLDKWTQLYAVYKEHTLTAYFGMMEEGRYDAETWAEENERWRIARDQQTIDEEIEVLSASKMTQLRRTWSDSYSKEELLWLENFYNNIIATQNVSTPILQEKARDFCEIQLNIKKGLRAGQDVKKLMDAADNIVKTYHFEANNAKNAADFESVGELMVYYGKKGWHPKWHTEPKDSIDFMMQNIQNYLKRLVINEGNFAEQVEDRRARYNMTERLEEMDNEELELIEQNINYEGENELLSEIETGGD